MNTTTNTAFSAIFPSDNIKGAADFYDSAQHSALCVKGDKIIDLSPLTLVSVTGQDSQTFLQGQFSNDLTALEEGVAQLHGYCNPKGRALCLVRILKNESGFWLLIPQGISEQITKRLKMFKMRAKVEINVETDKLAVGVLSDSPEPNTTFIHGQRFRVAGAIPREIVIIPVLEEGSPIDSGQKDITLFDHSVWRLSDILSGIPQVHENTVEEFIPQMINLDIVEGVSFKKGCYPGQEIVARLRYLGKLKQRMAIAIATTDETLLPGDTLYEHENPEKKCGVIVDAITTSANQVVLTAMAPVAFLKEGQSMKTAAGATVEIQPLPYEIPPDKKPQK